MGLDSTVDRAGMDSFPASDPPPWSAMHLGPPCGRRGPEAFHDVVQHIRDDVWVLADTIGERNDRSARGVENLARAADVIEARFHDAGLPVKRRSVNQTSSNIEAVVRGGSRASECVVVAAHYDSPARSPGADDNASGVACLLALARSLSDTPLERTVRLVALSSEEPPHLGGEASGSVRYLDDLRREGPKVSAMMSIEGVGVYDDTRRRWPMRLSRVLRSDLAIVGDRANRELLERVKRAFDAVEPELEVATVTLPLFFSGLRASSHLAFARAGIPAFMITDTGPLRSLEYHRERDTADRLDYERVAGATLALHRVVSDLADRRRPVEARAHL